MRYKQIKLEAEIYVHEALEQIDVNEVVDHFGEQKILELIGKQRCISHFGLVEDEEAQ